MSPGKIQAKDILFKRMRKGAAEKKRRKSVFFRFLFGYISLSVFTVSLVTVILYNIFSYNSIQEIDSFCLKMLSQTRYSTDFIWSWASSFGYSMFYDNTISHAMYTEDFDLITQFIADRKITQAFAANSLIDSMYIYNGHSNRYLSSLTSALDEKDFFDRGIVNYIKRGSTNKTFELIPRKAVFHLYNQETERNLITLLFRRNAFFDDRLSGALIVNISSDKFNEFIQSTNPDKNNTIFIFNKEGKIIYHTDPEFFLSDFSERDYIKKIIGSGSQEGSFIQAVDGVESIICYVYLDHLDWWFVSNIPKTVALAHVMSTRNTSIIIAVFILFTLIALEFILTRKLYSPVQDLVNIIHDKIDIVAKQKTRISKTNDLEFLSNAFSDIFNKVDSLEKHSKDNEMFIKNQMLKNILLNNHVSLREPGEILDDLGIEFNSSASLVSILSIDNFAALKKNMNDEELASIRKEIISLTSDFLCPHFQAVFVDMGDDHIAVIVNIVPKTADAAAEPLGIFESIIDAIHAKLRVSATVSVGMHIFSANDLCTSYWAAKQQLNYRLVYGPGKVITAKTVQVDPNTVFQYPDQIEKNILNNLRLRHYKKVEAELDNFFCFIRMYPYNDIVLSLISLANSSLKTVFQMRCADQSNMCMDLRNVLNVIESSNSMDMIKKWFLSIYSNAVQVLDGEKIEQKAELIKKVCVYVDKNYTDPLLSIERISETAFLSPNYLRVIFKEVKGQTISEYITNKRFDTAYELLLRHDYTAAKIAAMSGFNSATYFYTAFKKRFGLTPENFRKKMSKTPMLMGIWDSNR